MSYFCADTTPEVETRMIEGLRAMTPQQRLSQLPRFIAAQRRLRLAGLRQRYPDDPPELLRRRLADLLLGPDLAAKAYGPLEPIDGVRGGP